MARTTARWAGLLGVARALRASNRPGGPGLGEQLSAVPRMVGASVQGLLLVFGLVDDAAIAAVIAGWLLGEADNYLTWERRGMFVVPGKTLPGETLYRGV